MNESEAFNRIIEHRRSVRSYTAEKVPQEIMEEVLQWGLLAPTSSNLQCWEFYWLKDPSKKAKLVEALFSQPAAKTAQELIVAVAKLNTWKRTRLEMLEHFKTKPNMPAPAINYYKKLVPMVYTQGPLSFFGFFKRIIASYIGVFRPIIREPYSRSDMKIWATKTTALACQNIMMGFAAHGFDTCPMEGYDSKRIKKILNLGRDSHIVMAISVGKRDEKGVYGERIRMPKEHFIKVI